MKQQHTLQPKLRFPEFDDSFKNVYLKDIAKFSKGKNISKADIIEDGTIECIRYGELYTTYGEVINKIFSKTNLDEKNLVFSEANDIIIPASGESAIDIATASCVIKDGVALGGDLNIIKTKENGVFLSYYFNNKKKYEIAKKSQGISVIHIYSDHLKSLNLNIPSLPEQQKIADYLSTIDCKINLLEEKKTQLALYKKAMMQKLFAQEIRFKPTQCHTELVEVGIDEVGAVEAYPDWEEKRLGEVFSGLKGQGLSKDSLLDEGENNCILYGELFTKYKEVIKSVISKTNILSGVKSKSGDILIPASTTTKAFDLANATALLLDNVILGGDINILRPKQKLSSEFYAYYLSNYKKHELGKLGQGITIVHLYYTHFKNIMIDLPSLAEQQKIADFLSAIDESIEKVTEQISQTQSFKKAMLQQLFV